MAKLLPDNATLVERHDLDRTLAVFRIRPDHIPEAGQPWFEPGQYVTIGMTVKDGPEFHAVQRAYSIVSDPADRDALEFYIRLASRPQTDRPLTYLVWPLPPGSRLNVGAKITGRFTLGRTVGLDDPRWKVFVAAGTGIAPFISMIRTAKREGANRLRRFALIHGVSYPHELAYRKEIEEARERFGVVYLPAISRPAERPEWTGHKGRAETFFEDGNAEVLEWALGLPAGGLTPENAAVYVCGFRGTIAETTRRLLRRGFVPEDRRMRRILGIGEASPASLFFEQYDLEPVFDPNDEELIASLKRDVETGTRVGR